jgi:hypothetical protein
MWTIYLQYTTSKKKNIKQILEEFNNMQPTIKFKIEKEQKEK